MAVSKRIGKLLGSLTGKTAKLLENRFVLYCVFIIALINIYVLLLHSHFNGLSVFFLTGLIVSAFNKNMIVILLSAIILTNLVKEAAPTFYEGFDGGEDAGGEDDQKESKSLTEDVSNVLDGLKEIGGDKTGKNTEDLKEITEDYSKLREIQEGLLEGIKKVSAPLETAEKIIEKLTNRIEGMQAKK